MPKKLNLKIGETYGFWTVESNVTIRDKHHTKVHVRCECGVENYVRNSALVSGDNVGCMRCTRARYNTLIPFEVRRRLLGRISHILIRCLDETNVDFPDYGGRGIKVVSEWVLDRGEFLAYLLTLPGWDNPKLMIDRINNEGHYEPGNLRFADNKTQANNRRNRRWNRKP